MTLQYVDDNSIDKSLFAKISFRAWFTHETHSGNIKKITTSEVVETLEFAPYDYISPSRKLSFDDLTANGHWYPDRDNDTVYFYYDGTDANVVALLNIFVTTAFDVLGPSDLDSSVVAVDLVMWEGRLKETSFTQSIEDILGGKFGINSAEILIINNDSKYNHLATGDVIFKNANIKVWVSINSLDNVALIFKGVIDSTNFSGSDISLSVTEVTKVLQDAADTLDDSTVNYINKSYFPNADDDVVGNLIPMSFGAGRNRKTKPVKHVYNKPDGSGGYYTYSAFSFEETDSEFDIKTSLINVASTYKQYVICKIDIYNPYWDKQASNNSAFISNISGDSFTYNRISIGGGNYLYSQWTVDLATISYVRGLFTGAYIWIKNQTTDLRYEMIVTKIIGTYISFRPADGSTLETNPITGSTLYSIHHRGPSVYIIKDDVPIYLHPDQYSFSRTSISSSGGINRFYYKLNIANYTDKKQLYYSSNEIKEFQLTTNSAMDSPDDIPNLDYYVKFSDDYYLTTVLSNIIDRYVGLETDFNESGINSSINYLSLNGLQNITVSVSTSDGTNNKPYLSILEELLSDYMLFMAIKSDGKITIRRFESEPFESILLELTEDDVKDGTINANIDFSEMASEIVTENYKNNVSTIQISYSSKISRLLGNISYKFRNGIIEDGLYLSQVMDIVEAYKFNPIKKYTFTVINKGYELTLGDRISLNFDNSGKWLGTNDTKELFIIGLTKSLSGVVVTAIENIFP